MTRRTTTLFALMLLAGAGLGLAGTFTVTLTNGTTFTTRYRPVEAEWDDRIVLIHTDRGNPIALEKDELADVTSSVEVSGFGYQANTTTLFVGWSPIESAEEEGEEGAASGDGGRFAEPAPATFTVEQFINPPTAAGTIGGVPADTGF